MTYYNLFTNIAQLSSRTIRCIFIVQNVMRKGNVFTHVGGRGDLGVYPSSHFPSRRVNKQGVDYLGEGDFMLQENLTIDFLILLCSCNVNNSPLSLPGKFISLQLIPM